MTARRISASLLASALILSTGIGARAEELPKPRTGCVAEFTDPANDASYSPVSGQKVVTDAKTDITDVMGGTKGRTAFFYIKMPNGDGTTGNGSFGPRWDIYFDVQNTTSKTVHIVYAIPNSNYKAVNDTAFPLVDINGTQAQGAVVTATWDATLKSLVVAIGLDDIATRVGATTAAGTKFEKFYMISGQLTTSITSKTGTPSYNSADHDFDRAPDSNSAYLPYAVGDNKCFAPPASKLANLAGTTAQFSDAANLSAKLTDAAGATAVAGKQVTFAIAGKSVTATTGADGVAKASLAHGKTAGSYPLTVSFAGDDSYDKSELTGTLTVKQESTRIPAFRVSRSGTKRTVTVTVLDDDGKAVAGQNLNWYVNGRKVAGKRTDGRGNAVFTAAAGQTVVADFPAVAGRYLATKSKATRLA